MKKIITIALMLAMLSWTIPCQAIEASVRIMDLAHIKGVRENQLVGYGLVVGLPGTGDNSRSTQITNKMLLRNLGTVIDQENYIQKGASAAVIVTATVPPFSKNGDKIDVTVSAMADCKSLEGGVLVQTILKAPNGEAVAVAQGPLSVGGINKIAGGSSARTAITTSGRIPGGAIIERDIYTEIGDENSITLCLDKSDYTLVSRIAKTVSRLAPSQAVDGSSVRVEIPQRFLNDRVTFISLIENMEVSPTLEKAKVVVNERTGTVVIGADVKLLPAAVAHGNITVTVTSHNEVSQPNSFANGATVGFENADIEINKAPGSLIKMPANSNLNDLVTALNSIGVAPVDLISILQALKKSGSLQAELIII
ncbi:MAG: flagellar basal body P-ring protein FlgI [bacterium]|nr:flagellar basal body P-ring protein FlgI [bacterium]